MQEKRIFFTRMHPRKHAQEAIFPVIYSVFLHISNTDFDPQKSANHRAPPTPPWLPQKKRLTFPTLSVITLVPILFLLVFLLFFWLSCFGSRCLRGCCELVDVVGASLLGLSWGTPSWGLCWSILGLCWGYVGVCWPMLAHLGIMLGVPGFYVGPSWLYLGAILGLCWVCWVVLGLCWPSLGLCWAFLGSMLGHLGSVLAYLGACCAMQQLDSL